MLVRAALVGSFAVAIVLTGCQRGPKPSRSSGPPSGVPTATGIDGSDAAFCNAVRSYRASCGKGMTPDKYQDCLEGACVLRIPYDRPTIDAIRNCTLRLPCGASYKACLPVVYEQRMQSPVVRSAHARCEQYAARCGPPRLEAGTAISCAEFAQMDQGKYGSCLDESDCARANQCFEGRFKGGAMACYGQQ